MTPKSSTVPLTKNGEIHGTFKQALTCDSSAQDEYLDRFLSLCHAAEQHKIPARIGEANFEAELKKSVMDLVQSKSGPLVGFMPLLLDKLTGLMVRPPVISGQVGKYHLPHRALVKSAHLSFQSIR